MKRDQFDLESPVVIGGLGGSGTRVVAEILNEVGYYIGNKNYANDNLWFAFLVRRPKWMRRTQGKNVKRGLEIHNRINFGFET